jgi:hypothetical protein
MRRRGLAVLLVVLTSALTLGAGAFAHDAAQKGRYKKQGTLCVWDARDSGSNQCTPIVVGRFKKSGRACVWEPSEQGANECRPKLGRFKKDGGRCVWSGRDSGPDQCDPRRAK